MAPPRRPVPGPDRRERRLLVGAPQLRRPAPQPHHVVGAQQPRVRGAAQLEDVRRGGERGDVSAVGGRALQQLHRLQLGELDEAERGARRPQRVLQEAQLRAGRRKVEEAAHLPRAGNQGGAHTHVGMEGEGACAPSRDVEGGRERRKQAGKQEGSKQARKKGARRKQASKGAAAHLALRLGLQQVQPALLPARQLQHQHLLERLAPPGWYGQAQRNRHLGRRFASEASLLGAI